MLRRIGEVEEQALVRVRSAPDGTQQATETLRWPAIGGLAAVVSSRLIWVRAVSEAVLRPLIAAIEEPRRRVESTIADQTSLGLALAYGELHQKLDEATKGAVNSEAVLTALGTENDIASASHEQKHRGRANNKSARKRTAHHPVLQLLLYPGFGLTSRARELLLAELVSDPSHSSNDMDRLIEEGDTQTQGPMPLPVMSALWIISALNSQYGPTVVQNALRSALARQFGLSDPWPTALTRGRFGPGGWAFQRFLWDDNVSPEARSPKVHAVDPTTHTEIPFRTLLVPRPNEGYTGLELDWPMAPTVLATEVGVAYWTRRPATSSGWTELTLGPTRAMNAAEWLVHAWELARRDANLAGLPPLRTSIDGIRVESDVRFQLGLHITPPPSKSTIKKLRPSQNLRRLQWVSDYEAKQGNEPLKGMAGATEAQQRLFAAILWGVAALQHRQAGFLTINSAPDAESLGPPFSGLTRLWPAEMTPLAIEWARALSPGVMVGVEAPAQVPKAAGQALARWVYLITHLSTQHQDPTFLLMPVQSMGELALIRQAVQEASVQPQTGALSWIRANEELLREHLPSLPWRSLIPRAP